MTQLNGIVAHKLYNGEIELIFNEAKHLYTVGGYKVDGTTSVLGVINKPALMPWGIKMAVLYIEEQLKPGVAYDEIQITTMLSEAKMAHRRKSKEAADIGSLVHNWCKEWIAGNAPELPVHEEAKRAVGKFLAWVKEKNVKFLESERMLYSKRWGYAGTVDFIAEIDGKVYVGDFKTSTGIWDEYWFQVAAYQQAYTEEFPDKKIDGTMIVRIGKEHADIEIEERTPEDYKGNVLAFNAALVLFRRINAMKDEQFQKKREAGYGVE